MRAVRIDDARKRRALRDAGWKYWKQEGYWVMMVEGAPMLLYNHESIYISRYSKMGLDIKDFYDHG